MSSLSSYEFPSISLYEQGEYLSTDDGSEELTLASASFWQEHGFPVEGQIAWPSVFCEDELVYTKLSVLAKTRKASIIGR